VVTARFPAEDLFPGALAGSAVFEGRSLFCKARETAYAKIIPERLIQQDGYSPPRRQILDPKGFAVAAVVITRAAEPTRAHRRGRR
jgi:hypothetical protein